MSSGDYPVVNIYLYLLPPVLALRCKAIMRSILACVRLDFGGTVSAHFAQQTTGTGAVAHLGLGGLEFRHSKL